MTPDYSRTPSWKPGDVVYFYYLHLDTARELEKENCHIKEKHRIYEVEGKARPMLILSVLPRDRSVTWYLVLRSTRTRPREKSKAFPIDDLIDSNPQSWLIPPPERYPENLVSCEGGRKALMKKLDKMEFNGILESLVFEAMKSREHSS